MKLSDLPIVLYADEHWLVVDKPYGLATHGGDAGDLGVQEWLELHLNEKTFVCSRLDKGTTGVLLFARNAAASARAEKIHLEESSSKVYFFLSHADVSARHGNRWVSELPLDGKSARTEFTFENRISNEVVLYRAVIARGRMHQIRRHAAASGCPLWGDVEYGGVPAPRIALHCAELTWPEIEQPIRSEMPASFLASVHSQGKNAVECAVAIERRGRWPASIATAWRVVQRGELQALDVSVDVYGQHALVWVYDVTPQSDISKQLAPLISALEEKVGVAGAVFRRIARNPHKQGLVQEVWTVGSPAAETFSVEEHGWQALVTLTLRQHVGLFLDHRDNRRRVEKMASGKKIANLFAYTCAFAVAAARGGADVVMNVDASASALNLGKKNFELNSLHERRVGKFIERDVRVWLEKQVEKVERGDDAGWDIVICDPPTFSSTKEGGAFHVAKAWEELSHACSRILKEDGVVFFSSNCQAQEQAVFEKALRKSFSIVQRLRAPLDFPEISGRSHARFFECRKTRIEKIR